MTTLENARNEQLLETFNLLFDSNLNRFDRNNSKENVILNINNQVRRKGYDGPNNIDTIYWFSKGLKLPNPRNPRRYIDSDVGFFNNLRNISRRKTKDDSFVKISYKSF